MTKLQDGRVLVCGGADVNLTPLGTGEVSPELVTAIEEWIRRGAPAE